MKTLSTFNIQRFSTHDGSGIRTNIFFKGCPLRCKWCSNPESQSRQPELLYDARSCKDFRDCIRFSDGMILKNDRGLEIRRENIKNTNDYRSVCPAQALTVAGEEKSIPELLYEIEKDRLFFLNGQGGITFSGGEPFFQEDTIFDLAREIQYRGMRLAVETCLHFPWKKIEKHLDLFDLYMVDVKHTDPDKFRYYTGGNLDLINENLRKLSETGANIIARVPVIPGFNFTNNELLSIIDFILSISSIREIHFIPYHALGEGKYEMLGREYVYHDINSVRPEVLDPYVHYAEERGLKTDIGG